MTHLLYYIGDDDREVFLNMDYVIEIAFDGFNKGARIIYKDNSHQSFTTENTIISLRNGIHEYYMQDEK